MERVSAARYSRHRPAMASAIILVEARGVHVSNVYKGEEINEIVKRVLSTKPLEKIKINPENR
tara:strand:- start:1847 stop:2035 length:189 start_codon:yes stop_codon:yes gene_type:complete